MKENYTSLKNEPIKKNNPKMKTGSKIKKRTNNSCSMSALDLEPIPHTDIEEHSEHLTLQNITHENMNEKWLNF